VPQTARPLEPAPNIIRATKSRSTRWEKHVALTGEMKNVNVYNISVGRTEGMRPLGRSESRCEVYIRMDWETVREGVVWVHLTWDRDQWHDFVNTLRKLRVP
jgi:hypothetical protein